VPDGNTCDRGRSEGAVDDILIPVEIVMGIGLTRQKRGESLSNLTRTRQLIRTETHIAPTPNIGRSVMIDSNFGGVGLGTIGVSPSEEDILRPALVTRASSTERNPQL
jgi:hypothetical protein